MADATRLESILSTISSHIYQFHQDTQLTRDELIQIIDKFRPIYTFDETEAANILKLLETKYVTTMGEGISLINEEVFHDDTWYSKRTINWSYWKDYEQFLINQGWPTHVVSSMNSVTNRILGLLHDPYKEGGWKRRGLVIGHVQSGKTANYIGLISKAADAGYKFIIVIAGIHNNLRTQTQARIDEGFIGRDSRTSEWIGVSKLRPKRALPVTVTTTESDFNKAVAKSFGMKLDSLNRTFILVIKKNVNTLSSLYNWLKELNTREELEKITDIPMLLIDDEADNASINTRKPELDPTRTNKEIRSILNLFRKHCYVGYTATPFANVFINPDGEDEMLGSDLFPSDFIYCLDAPTNYCGAEKMFPDRDQPDEYQPDNHLNESKFIREIDDAEEYIPLRHKKDDLIVDLPPSLKKAIRTFILSRAIRNLKGHTNHHCSMMINVSRFVNTQRQIKSLTEFYVGQIGKAIRFNYRLSIDKALNDATISQLHQDFLEEYSSCDVDWEDVLAELNNAASAIRVFLVNSKSDEALDYTIYEKGGNSLTAIAIGGLSLSRGLTIEGLTVSYIYRNSKMYDTLMQMGRWFGYRDDYEDLCRVYMSDASYGWYCHISEATEELRMQVKRMSRDRKKPSDFGLYVRAHPDTLIVTAKNKMYHTEDRALRVSYDGRLMETHILPESEHKNDRNRNLLTTFYSELQESAVPYTDSTTNSLLFRNVSWKYIQDFVFKFQFHIDMFDLQDSIPSFINEISDIYSDWDVAFRSVRDKPPKGEYMIASQIRTIGYEEEYPRRPILEDGWYTGNKNRFSGNSMFRIGLSNAQLRRSEVFAKDADRKKPIFSDYTNARGKPIMLLHLLDLVDRDKNVVNELVPALSVSFPNSDDVRTVKYVVNPVWLKQFEENQYDSLEEDDYDLEL